jgi:hypothetical protein
MSALQEQGRGKTTGPTALEVIRAVDEANKIGAKRKAPRRYVKNRSDGTPVVYVLDGKKRRSLHVAIRAGMTEEQVDTVSLIALKNYKKRSNDEYLEEVAPEDLTLYDIHERWVDFFRATSSHKVNKKRELYGRHLFGHQPEMRYGDLKEDFGVKHVAHRVAGLPAGKKKDDATRYAIEHLEGFATALELFLLNVPVEKIRRFIMPYFEQKSFPFYLTWDWFMRIVLIARGWEWDKDNECWKKQWDPESGRWVLCYDRSRRDDTLVRFIFFYAFSGTRDSVIPVLTWGVGRQGGTVDAKGGIIVRRPFGYQRTNKRAEPADLFGPLRTMVKRWEFADALLLTPNVVHDAAGSQINDVGDRFKDVARRAGLPWVTPHYCKHFGATLYTYAGVDREDLADAFCTLSTTLWKHYIHLQVKWRDKNRRYVDGKTLTLLGLRHLMPPSNEEWLRAAKRLKEEWDRAEREKAEGRRTATAEVDA